MREEGDVVRRSGHSPRVTRLEPGESAGALAPKLRRLKAAWLKSRVEPDALQVAQDRRYDHGAEQPLASRFDGIRS